MKILQIRAKIINADNPEKNGTIQTGYYFCKPENAPEKQHFIMVYDKERNFSTAYNIDIKTIKYLTK